MFWQVYCCWNRTVISPFAVSCQLYKVLWWFIFRIQKNVQTVEERDGYHWGLLMSSLPSALWRLLESSQPLFHVFLKSLIKLTELMRACKAAFPGRALRRSRARTEREPESEPESSVAIWNSSKIMRRGRSWSWASCCHIAMTCRQHPTSPRSIGVHIEPT